MKRLVVGIHEAERTFSKLVREAETGSEVVIEDHGKRVAMLIGYKPPPVRGSPG